MRNSTLWLLWGPNGDVMVRVNFGFMVRIRVIVCACVCVCQSTVNALFERISSSQPNTSKTRKDQISMLK